MTRDKGQGTRDKGSRHWIKLFLLSIFLCAVLPAQGTERTQFVFHVYVDPLHGDNLLASQHNPRHSYGAPRRPLDTHPEPQKLSPNNDAYFEITGYLQHAPYHFRTLTGVNGAMAYVVSEFVGVTPSWTHPLYANPDTGKTVEAVIIHCLPGVYGPFDSENPALPRIDPRSGLPFNGEQWPVYLPDRVSLQGASGLDTIFDARHQSTPIIVVADQNNTGHHTSETHAESFIDSIALCRARANGSQPSLGDGAAIYIHPRIGTTQRTAVSSIAITNCFIYDNVIGIAIDANAGDSGGTTTIGHTPRIFNNTIAWNACGLWAGDTRTALEPVPTTHLPRVVNNIFDSSPPDGFGYIAGISCFEGLGPDGRYVVGIHNRDIRVAPMSSGIDFNAWEVGRINLSVLTPTAIAPNWPATLPTTVVVTPDVPRVDLTPWTRGSGIRGALYISDTLRRWPPQGVPGGFNYSPHDFRLTPNAAVYDSQVPGGFVFGPSPLVNMGANMQPVDQSLITGPIDMFFLGAAPVLELPGLSPDKEGCPTHGFDWDVEGFGNKRLATHPAFTAVQIPCVIGSPILSTTDIGADQLGTLIMGGFVESTRIFSMRQVAPNVDQTLILYFNLIQGGANPGYMRPVANLVVGGKTNWGVPGTYRWYDHKTTPLDTISGSSNYADAAWFIIPNVNPSSLRGVAAQPSLPPPYHPFPRALECDFGGHLLPDPHPFWGVKINYTVIYGPDPYAGNPWYGSVRSPLLPPHPNHTYDNPTLYFNVGTAAGRHGIIDSQQWEFKPHGFVWTAVLDATINPPGTTIGGAFYLHPDLPLFTFGPWGPCPVSIPPIYQIGPYGYGDLCLDRAPYSVVYDQLGIRYNCQSLDIASQATNLQTMLAVSNDLGQPVPVETLKSPEDGSPIRYRRPSVEALRESAGQQRRSSNDPR